jgi:hypothetical protein
MEEPGHVRIDKVRIEEFVILVEKFFGLKLHEDDGQRIQNRMDISRSCGETEDGK